MFKFLAIKIMIIYNYIKIIYNYCLCLSVYSIVER